MRRAPLAQALAAAGLLAAGGVPAAHASSHREAPMITQTPKLDGTDFYMFRSYQPGRDGYVTLLADYQPFQAPGGGPNYFQMDPDAFYDIHVDNTGSGTPDITFRFKFNTVQKAIALPIGKKMVPVPLVAVGQIGVGGDASDTGNANIIENYTVTMIRKNGSGGALQDANGGSTTFGKPIDNIGAKTLPDYNAYAANFVRDVNIPGCGAGRVFAGQRKDPFVVNLGQTFDLVNYANPVGEQFARSTKDDLAGQNVTTLALEVPIACLTAGGDPVIGGWTTSSKVTMANTGHPVIVQSSRLGNPLVNELVIGLRAKDRWNKSVPLQDAQFAPYVTNPTFPTILASLFAGAGVQAPTAFPRADLVSVFLTGLAGVNAPAHLAAPAEEMRLNTAIPVTAAEQQSRLGVIGGDNAGYPNGRRPGDDVVDITLRVAMGRLYTLGLFGNPSDAPSGGLDFTDGAYVDAGFFDAAFPYVKPPLPGSP